MKRWDWWIRNRDAFSSGAMGFVITVALFVAVRF